MFSITYDPARQQISTVTMGLLTTEQARAFADALGRQMIALMQQRQPFRLLMDTSQSPVQPQASYDQFKDMGRMVKKAAPTAIVVGSALGKLQAARDIHTEGVRIFPTVADAQRWLASIEPGLMEVHAEMMV